MLPLFPEETEKAEQEKQRAGEVYRRIQATAEANADTWYPTSLSHFVRQPFKALIAAMLSAQTREEQTTAACQRLFALADNPVEMLALSDAQILEAITMVSFVGVKLAYVRDICTKLVEAGYTDGNIPRTVDELVAFKGVGWKVATLTLLIAYGRDEDIPVDVHVRRIGMRLGFVDPNTKQDPQVSEQLKAVLPREAWAGWNPLMVQFGREICRLKAPKCKTCPVNDLCPKIGVL